MKLHSVSINLSKIRKERIHVGEKGKYLNLTIAEYDEKDQYGNNVAVWEGQTEEERKNKVERHFLGNGKTVFAEKKEVAESATQDDGGDLPF